MKAKHINAYQLADDVIIARFNDKAKDLSGKSHYIVSGETYNIFIRDGKIVGMLQPYGGHIYPRSKNCIKPPSVFAPRYTSFSVLTIPKNVAMKFVWDVDISIQSPVSDKIFEVKFPLILSPVLISDLYVSKNMERFMNMYNLMRSHRTEVDSYEQYTNEDLKSLIGDGIIEAFKKLVSEYLESHMLSFQNSSSSEDISISQLTYSLYRDFDDLLGKYGLELQEDYFYKACNNYLKPKMDLILNFLQTEK